MLRPILCCATALVVSTSQLQAIETANPLEEMTVTSSRVETPLRQLGTSLSVITAQQIEEKGHSTVAEVLRSLTGIAVSNNGGVGKQTVIRIRGEEGYRTKIFIDGVDVSDPTGLQAQPQIQHLLSADIERIEILRGPQGMMYGADAGGVINIITKKANDTIQGNASVEYGRYNNQQFSGNLRGKIDRFDYSLAVADLSTDGFDSRNVGTIRDDDGYSNTTATLSMGFNVTEQFRIQGLLRDVDTQSEYDGCSGAGSSSNICDGQYQQNNYLIEAILKNTQFEHKLSYSVATTERANFTGKTMRTFATKGELEKLQFFGNARFNDMGQLVYGIDLEEDNVTDIRSNKLSERGQRGVYVEWQGNISDNFFYTAGIRDDVNDDYGSNNNHRVSVAYLVAINGGEIKLKSSYGTGFRAPSLSELAYNANASTALPILNQETSKGYDVGAVFYGKKGLSLELTYFNQDIQDEIFFDLLYFTGYLQGSDQTNSKGIEFAFELPINQHFNVYGNYTHNQTKDFDGEQRSRRPKNIANIGTRISAMDNTLIINADCRRVESAVNKIYGRGKVKLNDYTVVNINISYAIRPEIEVYVRGENILNKKYTEITGYNTAGAAAYTGFRYRF